MKTVAELIERIERDYTVGPSTETRLAVTGEPYVVIGQQKDSEPSIPGTVDEPAPCEAALDEETACYQALSCFETYAEDRGRYLYWREKPRLEWMNNKRCKVYMRCLVSEKAPPGH